MVNKDIKELILVYVDRYFRHEKDFYRKQGINFTDTNWQKFKKGETSIEKMGAARVDEMLRVLFTPFELSLIHLAQRKFYFSNEFKFRMTFPTFYDIFKKEILMTWLERSPEDIVGGKGRLYTADGNQTVVHLELALESSKVEEVGYLSELRFKGDSLEQCPAGRENRLDWVRSNLESLR